MSQIKVGYVWDSYPNTRSIIDIVDGVEYQKIFDYYKFLSYVAYVPKKLKLPNAEHNFADVKHAFNDFGLNKVDLLHFFNNISYGKTPWVSTFETFIPRFSPLLDHQTKGIPKQNKQLEKALKALAGDTCKKILAISECTANFETTLLNHYPEYKERIEQKMVVIHPPQKLLVERYEDKMIKESDALSFIIVGGDFFRKGGLEILRTFEKLVNQQNIQLQLTIVSKLDAYDYATKAGQKEIDEAVSIIERNQTWITHHKSLPNTQVLDLMKSHQIGLLPTWADTYGYSVLELQASGCPVITTDIRALSEINSNQHGWVIDVPKNEFGEGLYVTEEQRTELSQVIMDQLEKIVLDIFQNRDQVRTKAEKTISYVKEHHDPSDYADKIREIYKDALK
ncbi:glycosyltransferase family 4 protein [Marinilactibacillus sp. Marseille-P9653]|uniref:glycosyltransferase family 4 protein n=1 Tax=Marinilactibacillus sp. Marseille-P9653 TaxID=2866583 RepID=UPI001CE40C7E|nr:glycosyltransferase family 4 protein [Marinilactibacillus sp. Marseille-P9653]